MAKKDGDNQDPKKPIMKTRKISVSGEKKEEKEQEEVKPQKISSRKVIFIEIDEEITTICDRIRQIPHKKVYIVVPERALLFQSIVNLKILKRKASDLKKDVFIITNDQCGTHMSQMIGLDVFHKVHTEGRTADTKDKHLQIKPIEAGTNTLRNDTPSRLSSKKMTITQLVKSIKKKTVPIASSKGKLLKRSVVEKKEKKKKKKRESRFVLVAPNRHAVISLVVVSVLLLLTITYIALPSATVVLTPKSNQIEKFVNITLADQDRNRFELEGRPPNMIASYDVNATISKRVVHHATGKEFRGENASGTITVINKSNNDWPLVARTRFQTAEGIIYRSQGFVTVPKANGEEPGTVDISVVADEVDAYDQVVGDKGNIGPSKFFLPGLNASNQKLLFAESKESMTGGKTNVIKFITEDDITAAQEKLVRELQGDAENTLANEVDRMNREKNLGLVLLTGNQAVEYSEPSITIPDNLDGQKLDEFELFGEMTATGLAYNSNEMLTILKTELNSTKNPQKRLLNINPDSISYKIFDIDEPNEKVKITASIKGIEEYDIQPDRENGSRLIQKIKSHVLGKKVDEAELFIQNLPEINKVEIESWPFWAPTMPNVPENIKIVIDRAE